MKIILLSVGKTDSTLFTQIINDYIKRIGFYISIEMVAIKDIKNRRGWPENEQKAAEGANLLKVLKPTDHVVLLDESGQQYTSVNFARFIEKKSVSLQNRLVFIIGGPYGFSREVKERANEIVSLSKMTFTHQMVRLVFVEQLYRAMTILNNEPYHHQ